MESISPESERHRIKKKRHRYIVEDPENEALTITQVLVVIAIVFVIVFALIWLALQVLWII